MGHVSLLILWLNVQLGLDPVRELWDQNRMFVWFLICWENLNLNICVVWASVVYCAFQRKLDN